MRLPCAERTCDAGVFARSGTFRPGEITGGERKGRAQREVAKFGGCETAGSQEVDCGSGQVEQKESAIGEDGGHGQETKERRKETELTQRAQRKKTNGEDDRFEGVTCARTVGSEVKIEARNGPLLVLWIADK